MVAAEASRLRWTWDISAGQALQAICVVLGFAAWLISTNLRSEEALRGLGELRTQMAAQNTDLRSSLSGAFAELRGQISDLPSQRAELVQMERRFTDQERLNSALDARLQSIERAVMETRSAIDSIGRASAVTLPSRR